MDKISFSKIYDEVYWMWEKENQNHNNQYTKRAWIFPNHIDLVIKNSLELCQRYGGDEEICKIASLLHDVGLVYKRKPNSSPDGHELVSLEYAKEILKKFNYSQDKINHILECIKATQIGHKPKTIEEKIVATSDFISQFNSIHYFAKASFFNEIDFFVKWFKKRIEISFDKKIHFQEIKDELEPIRQHYLKIIELYENNL